MKKWLWVSLVSLLFFAVSCGESNVKADSAAKADKPAEAVKVEKKTDPNVYPIFSDLYSGGATVEIENGEAVAGATARMMIWAGTCKVKVEPDAGYNGTTGLVVSVPGGGNWFGFGYHKVNPGSQDMSGFENGHVKFYMKATPQSGDVKILIKHNYQTESWLNLDQYGMTNDNQWHLVSVPIADFIPKVTIKDINIFWAMAQGKTFKALSKYWVDEIVWTKD